MNAHPHQNQHPNPLKEINLLVVDDEVAQEIKENLEDMVCHGGRFKIDTAESCEEAFRKIDTLKKEKRFYDVMIVDMKMGTSDDDRDAGLSILEKPSSALKIVLTANNSIENCLNCIRAGAYDYIDKKSNKPYDRIIKSIERGLAERLNPPQTPVQLWLKAHEAELKEAYPGQWIAVIDEMVVDSGPDCDALQQRVKENYPLLSCHFKKIETI